MLALLSFAGMARLAGAQGANHNGSNGGDAVRCSSGKPEIAIIACTHIIEDRREDDEYRAIALQNRAYRYQLRFISAAPQSMPIAAITSARSPTIPRRLS